MGDVSPTLGVFGIGSMADLALFEEALRAEGVEDQSLFDAIDAHDNLFLYDPKAQKKFREIIAGLLDHPERKNYLLKARFRTGALLLSKRPSQANLPRTFSPPLPQPQSLSIFLHGESPISSSGRSPIFELMGAGSKKKRGTGGPSYPVFRLEDFEGRPLEERIGAALRFHTQTSYLRPPGTSRFQTRHQREEMEQSKLIHRRMALLLELPEGRLSLAEKGELIRLMHGRDQNVRNYLERLLKGLGAPLNDSGVGALRREVEKIGRHGFSNPIDLVAEMERQNEKDQAEARVLLNRFADGEIVIAVISSMELAEGLPNSLEAIFQKDSNGGDVSPSRFANLAFYGQTLVKGTERINLVRAHIADLQSFAARLKQVWDRLETPTIAEVDDQMVFERLGLQEGRHFLNQLPHGTITISRDIVQPYLDAANRSGRSLTRGRAEDHFPVVIVAPRTALVKGAIDLSRSSTIDLYALAGDEEKLKRLLSTTPWRERATLHPFLPFPEKDSPGVPNTFLMAALMIRTQAETAALERLASEMEAVGDLVEEVFPRRGVEVTRIVHSHSTHSIRQAVNDLEGQLDRIRQPAPDQDDWTILRARLAIRFVSDHKIPLELRATLLNLYSGEVGRQVDSFLDVLLRRYQSEGTTKMGELSRELLAGYFIHMPWAWQIMIEEGLKRELIWGIKNQSPLGVTEIPGEARGAAWRFAYAATHLMGFSEEQTALILRAIAYLPKGEEPPARHKRFARLSQLALPTDTGAFEFLRKYRLADDPGGARLRYFLARLDSSSEAETRWRFKSATLRHAGSHHSPEVRAAEGELTAALQGLAGSDPVHLWDLDDAVSLVGYHLAENLDPEKTILAFKNIALIVRGMRRLIGNGKDRDDDPLMREIKKMAEPSHFSDTLRALGRAFGNDLLAPHLKDLLGRQSANLHAWQYLLLALRLKEEFSQPDASFLRLFKEEKRLAELENGHGKIRNDQFLKYALFDYFSARLVPALFAMEMERRVAREFADNDRIAVVEVVPETWMESVVDFRIHPREGGTFLVEVKTLRYDGRDFGDLLNRLKDQVGKAGWQLSTQRRHAKDTGNQDQIILYIQAVDGRPFSQEEMERLRQEASQVVWNRGFNFVGTIRVEQGSGGK